MAEWKHIFLSICNKHTSIITSKVRGKKTPWVNDEYIKLAHKRDKLKKRAEISGAVLDWAHYRQVRNYVNNLRKTLKKEYYHANILENSRNPKHLWNLIKSVTSNKKTGGSVNCINVNGKTELDAGVIADEFNAFFLSVGSKACDTNSSHSLDQGNTQQNHTTSVFQFVNIGESFVLDQLKNIQTSKSCGPDGIPPKLLKTAAPVISSHLAYLFNLSLNSGIIPDEWKMARVTPIHKGGDTSETNNYRPISVIPIVMKVFERAIHQQLSDYLTEHSLLAPQQSGFRKDHSTDTVLAYLTDYMYKQMDHGQLIGMVFLDFRKAFDSVDHDLLLQKLARYGVQDRELKWFKNYLSGRQQKTVIGNKESEWGTISSGVPQGSILGPLLFTLMVNDMPKVTSNCRIMMYADDTVLFYSSDCASDLQDTLNKELDCVNAWVKGNRLVLNPTKTQYMIFGTAHKLAKVGNLVTLKLEDYELIQVKTYKYLAWGVP